MQLTWLTRVVILASLWPNYAQAQVLHKLSTDSLFDVPKITDHYDWQGFYMGVGGVYQQQSILKNNMATFDHALQGLLFGLIVGYNYNNHGIVVGGEMNYSNLVSSIDSKNDIHHKVTEQSSVTLKARLGYAMDKFLPYLSLGSSATSFNDQTILDQRSMFKPKINYVVGAGVDYAAMKNILLRVEYWHSGFGVNKVSEATGSKNTSSNEALVGVAYKF